MSTTIQKMVESVDHPDGPFKTIGQVAEYFERTPDTIRRWGEAIGVPTHKIKMGTGEYYVWGYTEDDIAALATHSEGINPKGGRPKKSDS